MSSKCDHCLRLHVIILAGWLKLVLSIALSTVYKSGCKCDVSNYKGTTGGSVIAKVFALILKQRSASWAEMQRHAATSNFGEAKQVKAGRI